MNHNEACARPPTNRIFPIRPHHCRLRSTPTTQSASEEESRGRRVDPTARIGRLERVRGRVGRRARASTTLRDGCVNAPLHTTVERGVRYEPCQSNPNSCECHVTRVPRWIGSYGIVTSGAVRGEAKRSLVVIRSVLVDSGITLSSRQVEAPTELVFRVFGYSLSLSPYLVGRQRESTRLYESGKRRSANWFRVPRFCVSCFDLAFRFLYQVCFSCPWICVCVFCVFGCSDKRCQEKAAS